MGWVKAAPPYLVQLFFKTARGNGFSEGYPVQAANYEACLDLVMETDGLVDVRRALMTSVMRIEYVRVSDTTRKRDTLVRGLTTGGDGTYVPTTGQSCPDDDALLLRWQGFNEGIPYFSLHPLRLIPEECQNNGIYSPTAAWETRLSTFTDWVAGNSRVMVRIAGNWTALTIASIPFMGQLSHRKVGRPFGQLRGRSLAP